MKKESLRDCTVQKGRGFELGQNGCLTSIANFCQFYLPNHLSVTNQSWILFGESFVKFVVRVDLCVASTSQNGPSLLLKIMYM